MREKRSLISPNSHMTIQRQCGLLGLERSSYYYVANESENSTELMNEIKDIWIEWPFYGYRKITGELADRSIMVNSKRVLRLMKLMDLRSVLPKPRINT